MIDTIVAAGSWLLGAFLSWVGLFYAPIQFPGLLWIILPIYLSWIITEFYQEKQGTSFGNAITNGVIVLWVAIDWSRRLIDTGNWAGGTWIKVGIAFVTFCYGFVVIWHGIQTRKYVHILGKIRNASYVMIIITPMMYSVVEITPQLIAAVVLFFPLFYYITELIDYLIPDPKAVRVDVQEIKAGGIGSQNGTFQQNQQLFKPNFNPPYPERVPLQFRGSNEHFFPQSMPQQVRKAF